MFRGYGEGPRPAWVSQGGQREGRGWDGGVEARRADVTFRLDPEGVSIRSHPKRCCEIGLSSDRCPPLRSSYEGALVTL